MRQRGGSRPKVYCAAVGKDGFCGFSRVGCLGLKIAIVRINEVYRIFMHKMAVISFIYFI